MVSVIIPTHCRASLLKNAIDSVIAQTYSDFEVIVISDGYDMLTDELLKKYCADDSRIYTKTVEPPQGGNHARNLGISLAKGEYVAFLDDDDEWMSTKLELQIKAMEDSKVGLVYTSKRCVYLFENNRTEYPMYALKEGDLSKDIFVKNYIGTTSTVMIRRKFLTEIFDEELEAMQDYDLWIRLCQMTDIKCIKKELIYYYNDMRKDNRNTQISSNTLKYENASRQIEEKYKELISELPHEYLIKRSRNKLKSQFNRCMRNNERKKAREIMKEKPLKNIIWILFSYLSYDKLIRLKLLLSKFTTIVKREKKHVFR